MLIDVGQVIAKKYELVRLLGRGSMGEVWSAHHQALGEDVALKVLTWPPSGEDAEAPDVALARFRFEAQVAARLSKKTRHIARVTDYGEDDGIPYLVMELLDGEALDAALRERGPLSPADATSVVSQIARALEQAHAEAVAHRDLKPANVFLTRDEDGRLLVKLLDFGIARAIHAHRAQGTFSTAKGFVFGTPGYMSPEQTRASPKLDHRCDLWSLATIAYQTLTGHLPVDGADADEIMKNVCAGRIVPLRERDPALSPALEGFFERAFADRIDDRFEGASQLAHAFELAASASASAPAPAPLVPLPTPSVPESGNTETEFSATVAHEVLRAHRDTRTRNALIMGGALVTASVVLGGVWRATASPRDPSAPPGAAAATKPFESSAKPAEPGESAAANAARASSDAPLAVPAAATVVTRGPALVQPPAPAVRPNSASTLRANAPPLAPANAPHTHARPAAEATPAHPAHGTPRPPDDRNDVF